ncbi:hypothetical protein R3X28_05075 [Maribacter sp. TH_r10]|uniref:hypothetical protein n=1 Tax=Maribacter sp. TH_r10 TaxID=3082086 RepID=UPI0029533E33|nr:hypothetical protein [Maribacter sp. TH_r10]MDV7138235.1 hypothetical protein [Maribacter sp. TH_r10]
MENISARDFYRLWIDTVTENKAELLGLWRNPTEFTYYIKGSDNSIISQIGHKMDLKTYEQDYYSIDTVFYKQEDLVPHLAEGNFWFRDIRIAFEHENSFNNKLYQEVSHLLITNCDLRVLVAYPPSDTPIGTLNSLHEIIKGNRNSKTNSDLENFLLIFGYENQFSWEGFIYKQQGWKEIN